MAPCEQEYFDPGGAGDGHPRGGRRGSQGLLLDARAGAYELLMFCFAESDRPFRSRTARVLDMAGSAQFDELWRRYAAPEDRTANGSYVYVDDNGRTQVWSSHD